MIYGLCKRGRLYEYNNVRDVISWRATRCHFTAHCIDNDIRLAYDCRRRVRLTAAWRYSERRFIQGGRLVFPCLRSVQKADAMFCFNSRAWKLEFLQQLSILLRVRFMTNIAGRTECHFTM